MSNHDPQLLSWKESYEEAYDLNELKILAYLTTARSMIGNESPDALVSLARLLAEGDPIGFDNYVSRAEKTIFYERQIAERQNQIRRAEHQPMQSSTSSLRKPRTSQCRKK